MIFSDPRPLRHELIRLLELQLSALEKEDFIPADCRVTKEFSMGSGDSDRIKK